VLASGASQCHSRTTSTRSSATSARHRELAGSCALLLSRSCSVTIGAGHAVETDGVSSGAHFKSSGPDAVPPSVAGPSSQLKAADKSEAGRVEAIEPYPMRMVRVRSSKAPSPLAGIPLGRTALPEPPGSASPASPENTKGPASPPASPPAQSVAATAEPAASGTKKKRSSAMHARRHQEDEDEKARRQNRRWPYWGERVYAEDRYWRGAYRYWVY
jgi:hypothetical protein